MITEDQLRPYGITGLVHALTNSASPDLLEYLDLVEPRRQHELLPDAVAESMGRPILFFVDESHPAAPYSEPDRQNDLNRLRRALACRGDRAYLARVLPGELQVVPVTLDEQAPDWQIYRAGSAEALTFFSRLVHGKYDGPGDPPQADFIFNSMFDLLKHGADQLAATLNRSDVLSLVGRALFFRFLRDRQIISEENTNAIAPSASTLRNCFDTAQSALASCQWLDRTFNGDFLPLTDDGSLRFFDDIERITNGEVFHHLGAIVRGDKPVGSDQYQLRFDWGDFDFAHIPVGLLSQVYEAFCWKWEHLNAKKTSVYYTPRNIAATLVDEAFHNVANAVDCKVLDPACGAGVFLVLAFRRLYRERWKKTRHRPDTRAIRDILEGQLTGFDISAAALKLAALSLYLTAIELDPTPVPPEKLKFKHLRNKVLFNFRRADESPDDMVIGSLGSHVDASFDHQFDLVLSNPPWTSLPRGEKVLAAQLTTLSQKIIERKAEPSLAKYYRNPDYAPDLPFLWKSTEWCKPDGRIAMALPARILLKQQPIPTYARNTLLRTIEVTGIINGSNLSDYKVWPGMQQPFMLLFARNKPPREIHRIQFITPYSDLNLNQRGEVRIDFKSAQPIEAQATAEEPWLWKALTVGTSLDVDVIRRLHLAGGTPLGKYWEDELDLTSGSGYMRKAEQTQQDATFLKGIPDLRASRGKFLVDTSVLLPFDYDTVCWPRTIELYTAPLVLIKQAPGPDRLKAWALLSFSDVTFNQSFHGYSSATHPEPELLARYLHLFANSLIRLYYALITRPRFGAERRVLDKGDLDECPIIPLDRLSFVQRKEVLSLSERLLSGDTRVFDKIDRFFSRLYGLDEIDLEVIRDTLTTALPYEQSRARASKPPTKDEQERFRGRLESLLQPFFSALNKQPTVTWEQIRPTVGAPFSSMIIAGNGRLPQPPHHFFQDQVLPLANDTGATRIILDVDGGLIIGMINQYRYWTLSRARLLAAEILSRHMAVFETG